jgi:hypothetical protein
VESSSRRLLSAAGLLANAAGGAEAAIAIAWLCASCRRSAEEAAVRHLRRAPPVSGRGGQAPPQVEGDGEIDGDVTMAMEGAEIAMAMGRSGRGLGSGGVTG